MASDDRCAEARKIQAIDEAFREGDLAGLRAAVEDQTVIPNGRMPPAIGTCLVYAIYRSPLVFIRTLLELGADVNAPADDGFPPLIAALSCTQQEADTHKRSDVVDVLRLLLRYGADPNQRGINDFTALHMAAAIRHPLAVQVLLDAGADPELRTRIDDYETPLEMARAAGATDIVSVLESARQPLRRRLRPGLMLLTDVPGAGDQVRRQHNYQIRLRLWLKDGQTIRWQTAWGPVGAATLEDDGETLVTIVRLDRRSLINGLFYGVEGMRVGGMRRLEIAPHLGYGDRGVPGVVPPNAMLTAEITILAADPDYPVALANRNS